MLSSTRSIALLALSSLALALPQQQQSAQTGQAVNPINGLPLPGAASPDDSSTASQAAPTLTGNSQTSPTSSPSSPDDSSESDSASADLITITSSASLAIATDASSPPTDSSSSEEDSPVVIIWTDTAQNTIYTVTRSTTTSIPIPTMQVPPDHATATMVGTDGKPTPTSEVDTFVQGYTGAGERVEVGDGRVWWLLLGAAAAVGAAVL